MADRLQVGDRVKFKETLGFDPDERLVEKSFMDGKLIQLDDSCGQWPADYFDVVRRADEADANGEQVNEFDDCKKLTDVLDAHEEDARARILSHLVAYYDLGEIFKYEVLHQQ